MLTCGWMFSESSAPSSLSVWFSCSRLPQYLAPAMSILFSPPPPLLSLSHTNLDLQCKLCMVCVCKLKKCVNSVSYLRMGCVKSNHSPTHILPSLKHRHANPHTLSLPCYSAGDGIVREVMWYKVGLSGGCCRHVGPHHYGPMLK